MRIAVVQGTRPEVIKNYAIVRALEAAGVPFEVLHTNQHSAREMCGEIYRDMGYEPHRRMNAKYTLGRAINWLQSVFGRDGITHVIVNGDTAASLAGAIAAMYLDIEVIHVEAGLRSRDPYMIEERNRIMVDATASLLFAYTDYEGGLLRTTPDIRGRVVVEGNTTVDVLSDFASHIEIPPRPPRSYVFVTMHRKEFTDSAERMRTVFAEFASVADTKVSVVFPMHPRTADAMRKHQIGADILGAVEVTPPISALESLAYQKHAAAVLTDSGCIQEEAYMLGVPCVTIRESTERHLTVRHGANEVTGFDSLRIREAVERAMHLTDPRWPVIYGDPGVGIRIVQHILEHAGYSTAPLTYASHVREMSPAPVAIR